jgi:hypothetical protein
MASGKIIQEKKINPGAIRPMGDEKQTMLTENLWRRK